MPLPAPSGPLVNALEIFPRPLNRAEDKAEGKAERQCEYAVQLDFGGFRPTKTLLPAVLWK